jgi:hypothetical protein
MKKSKSKSKKNVRPGFLVFMAALVLGTMGIVLYLIRGGGGGKSKSNVKCGGATSGYCDPGYVCTQDELGYKCVAQSCTTNSNLCQNDSTCGQDGRCICTGQFTGPFCDQVIPKGECNTDTCKLPHCIINRTYKEMKGFTPDETLRLSVACVNLKDSDGNACGDSPECLQQAKERCDRTPGCKSFYYYGTKGGQPGRWCPKVEFNPDKDQEKGKTDTKKYGNFYYVDKEKEKQNTCVCAVGFQNHPADKTLCTQCIDKRGPSRRIDGLTPATDCSMRLFGYKADGFSNTKFALQCQSSKNTTLKSTCTKNYGDNATYAGADDNCLSDPCWFWNYIYKCKVPAYWSDPAHNPLTFDTCASIKDNDGDHDIFPKWSSGPKKGQHAFVRYNGNLDKDGHVPDDYATGNN